MRGRRRKGLTLAEHDALLKAEGRYEGVMAEHRRREAELEREEAELREAEAPLVDELREAGYAVSSAWDLVSTAVPYPSALPILLAHLQHPYPDRVREGIARALAVPDAAFAWDDLARLYRNEPPDTDAKDGLAAALAATASESVVEQLIELAQDTKHGESRVLLLGALARSRTPEAQRALQELHIDPQLATELERLRRQL
jgi:HEAT repeat protein